jgi:hypothetical protein
MRVAFVCVWTASLLMKTTSFVVSPSASSSLPSIFSTIRSIDTQLSSSNTKQIDTTTKSNNEPWDGQVVGENGGIIRGCSVQLVDGSLVEWIVQIDGVEADLGRFSEAIYKKLLQDAKQQRFQGFRPGTIPPHLEPTYRTFAMDECARETVLEAMQQNNIKPFESSRQDMTLENFSIPPVKTAAKKKSMKKSSKKTTTAGEDDNDTQTSNADSVPPQQATWRTFATMKEAVDAGWRPGQSFSFIAKSVKGQQLKDESANKQVVPVLPGIDVEL